MVYLNFAEPQRHMCVILLFMDVDVDTRCHMTPSLKTRKSEGGALERAVRLENKVATTFNVYLSRNRVFVVS